MYLYDVVAVPGKYDSAVKMVAEELFKNTFSVDQMIHLAFAFGEDALF